MNDVETMPQGEEEVRPEGDESVEEQTTDSVEEGLPSEEETEDEGSATE